MAGEIVHTALNADHSDAGGSACSPAQCGNAAGYRGRRPKTLVSALGEMTITRACYLCDDCHSGFCPRDRTLGMTSGSLSPGVTRMVGMSASIVSFRESDQLLRELAGITVGAKMVERTAEALGRDIIIGEQEVITAGDPDSTRIYLGMDGTGTPMRAEAVRGRVEKQRRDELEAGDLQAIVGAFKPYLKTHNEARTCAEYIRTNWHRMQYPHFRRRGLCTSTGVVEAGCKLVVGTRLKRAGMHWTLHGANEIIALRSCELSGRCDDYCSRHGLSS